MTAVRLCFSDHLWILTQQGYCCARCDLALSDNDLQELLALLCRTVRDRTQWCFLHFPSA